MREQARDKPVDLVANVRKEFSQCLPDLGNFAAREKPYHDTACYRAMIQIASAVNRAGRDPVAVAAEILS